MSDFSLTKLINSWIDLYLHFGVYINPIFQIYLKNGLLLIFSVRPSFIPTFIVSFLWHCRGYPTLSETCKLRVFYLSSLFMLWRYNRRLRITWKIKRLRFYCCLWLKRWLDLFNNNRGLWWLKVSKFKTQSITFLLYRFLRMTLIRIFIAFIEALVF